MGNAVDHGDTRSAVIPRKRIRHAAGQFTAPFVEQSGGGFDHGKELNGEIGRQFGPAQQALAFRQAQKGSECAAA